MEEREIRGELWLDGGQYSYPSSAQEQQKKSWLQANRPRRVKVWGQLSSFFERDDQEEGLRKRGNEGKSFKALKIINQLPD